MIDDYISLTHGAAYYNIPSIKKLSNILGQQGTNALKIFEKYHSTQFKTPDAIRQKHALLEDGIDSIQGLSFNEKRDFLRLCTAKFKHLSCLIWLLDNKVISSKNPLYDRDIMQEYCRSDNPERLNVVEKTYFDYETNSFFGDYWLEIIDPSHRLNVCRLRKIWEKSGSKLPFFVWLESSATWDWLPMVDYELKTTHNLTIKNGFVYRDGLPYSTGSDVETIYVINDDGSLKACVNTERQKHTSLSKGKPIIGAGSFVIDNGIIKYLEISSGHYLPAESDAIRSFNYFDYHGACDGITKLGYFNNDSRFVKTNLEGIRQLANSKQK